MSVLVLDREVFQAMAVKSLMFVNWSTCDINYNYTLKAMGEKKIISFIRNIIYLNELSWCCRYKDERPRMFRSIELSAKGQKVSTLQLLKYFQCVEYNIEMNSIKEVRELSPELLEAHEILKEVISDLQNTVINHLTNYKELNWSNL